MLLQLRTIQGQNSKLPSQSLKCQNVQKSAKLLVRLLQLQTPSYLLLSVYTMEKVHRNG